MRICCWQPVLTAHQSYTLGALAKSLGAQIRVISSSSHAAERQGQGWTLGGTNGLCHELLPESGWRARISKILEEENDSVHIFGSPFERSKQNAALLACLRRRYRTFLIAEPYSPIPVGYLADESNWKSNAKARLRPILYQLYGFVMRRRLAGVFAISPQAVRQFTRMGIQRSRIFPFGYFVPLPAPPPTRDGRGRSLEIAYLGSYIERKGVDLLLSAFGTPEMRSLDANLTLYGPGSEAVAALASDPRISSGGKLPFGEVAPYLAKHDLVVVPSLYDGWAVVVNEAIGAGVPVVASDTTGASAMLERWDCGARFRSGDSHDLAKLLARICTDRDLLTRWRSNTGALSEQLQPQIAGDYMAQCILGAGTTAPPQAPWY